MELISAAPLSSGVFDSSLSAQSPAEVACSRPESDLDAVIIAGCQRGEIASQTALYDRTHRELFRLTARMIGRQDAPDVCQQIYLKIFAAIGQFAGRSNLTTWIYRIAVNECLQFRRRRGRHPTLNLADHEPEDRKHRALQRIQQRELLEIALGASTRNSAAYSSCAKRRSFLTRKSPRSCSCPKAPWPLA